jgi:hypothetical protein
MSWAKPNEREGGQEKTNPSGSRIGCCVMLNEVKHLLLLFPIPSIRKEKQILRRYTPQNDTGRKAA